MKIIFPSEAHTAVHLDSAIADCAARVARVKLGDGNSGSGVGSVLLKGPGRIINRGTRTLCFKVHVGALVLNGLKDADGFAELFPRFRIFDGDIECALHSTDGLGRESGGRNIESSRRVSRLAKLFGGCIIKLHRIKFPGKIHAKHWPDSDPRPL